MYLFVISYFFLLHGHFQKHGSGKTHTIFQKSKQILTDFHALDVFFVGLNLKNNISLSTLFFLSEKYKRNTKVWF